MYISEHPLSNCENVIMLFLIISEIIYIWNTPFDKINRKWLWNCASMQSLCYIVHPLVYCQSALAAVSTSTLNQLWWILRLNITEI